MPHIDYFFATVSPFTYLAGKRLEDIAEKYGATITYKPINLLELFSQTGGLPPKERHISRQEYRMQELQRLPKKLGLPLNVQPAFWPTNPAPSSYAIIAAQAAGSGDVGELAFSLARACWAEERDVSQDDVIRDCLEKAGFDPELTNSGMLTGAETYAANQEEAANRGVFGAPFYISETDQRFWGQDRLDDLDLHLAGKF